MRESAGSAGERGPSPPDLGSGGSTILSELGADHFDRHNDVAAHTHRLVRRLELLGHRVTLEPAA